MAPSQPAIARGAMGSPARLKLLGNQKTKRV
jgi:hypothetical protein